MFMTVSMEVEPRVVTGPLMVSSVDWLGSVLLVTASLLPASSEGAWLLLSA